MPSYGCSFFPTCTELPPSGFFEYRTQDWHIGVGPNAVVIVDSIRSKLIQSFTWSEIYWIATSDQITIMVNRRQRELQFTYITPQAAVVSNLIKNFKYKWAKECGALPQTAGTLEPRIIHAPTIEPSKKWISFKFSILSKIKTNGKGVQKSKGSSNDGLDRPSVKITVEDVKDYLPDTNLPENYVTPSVGIIGKAKKERRSSKISLFGNLRRQSSANLNIIPTDNIRQIVGSKVYHSTSDGPNQSQGNAIITSPTLPSGHSFISSASFISDQATIIISKTTATQLHKLDEEVSESYDSSEINQAGSSNFKLPKSSSQLNVIPIKKQQASSFDSSALQNEIANDQQLSILNSFADDLHMNSKASVNSSAALGYNSGHRIPSSVGNNSSPALSPLNIKEVELSLNNFGSLKAGGKFETSQKNSKVGTIARLDSGSLDMHLKTTMQQSNDYNISSSGSLRHSLTGNSLSSSDSETLDQQPRVQKSRSHATQLMQLLEQPEIPSSASNDNLDESDRSLHAIVPSTDRKLGNQRHRRNSHQPSNLGLGDHRGSQSSTMSDQAIAQTFGSKDGASSQRRQNQQGFRAKSGSSSDQNHAHFLGVRSGSSSNSGSFSGAGKPLPNFSQKTSDPTITISKSQSAKITILAEDEMAMFAELENSLLAEPAHAELKSERLNQRRGSAIEPSFSETRRRGSEQKSDYIESKNQSRKNSGEIMPSKLIAARRENASSSQDVKSMPSRPTSPFETSVNDMNLKVRRESNTSSHSGSSRPISPFEQQPVGSNSSILHTKLKELSSSSEEDPEVAKTRKVSKEFVLSDLERLSKKIRRESQQYAKQLIKEDRRKSYSNTLDITNRPRIGAGSDQRLVASSNNSSQDFGKSSSTIPRLLSDARASIIAQSRASMVPNPKIKEARLNEYKEYNPFGNTSSNVEIVDTRKKK